MLRLWSASHDGLRHRRSRAMRCPAGNSTAVRAAFDEIEPFYARMREAATRLLAAEPATVRNAQERDPAASQPSWQPRPSICADGPDRRTLRAGGAGPSRPAALDRLGGHGP